MNTKHLTFPQLIATIIETAAQHGASSKKLNPLKEDAARRIRMYDAVQEKIKAMATIITALQQRAKNNFDDAHQSEN